MLTRPFEEIFTTTEVVFKERSDAPLVPPEPCAVCGKMTIGDKNDKIG